MRTHIATKIALAIAFIIMGMVCLADTVGLVPDTVATLNRSRASICEMFAIQCASAITRDDPAALQYLATALAARNRDILSLGVRDAHDQLVAQAGPHATLWSPTNPDPVLVHVAVPLYRGGRRWGCVQFCFHPATGTNLASVLLTPQIRLVIFVTLASLLAIMFMLRRMLQHLDPSTVIPDRVKALLDTLAESVVVLDPDHRIVVINSAFSKATGLSPAVLVGQEISRIPWQQPDHNGTPPAWPWVTAARTGSTQRGRTLMLDSKVAGQRTFAVSAAPITGGGRQSRGVLVSLDDVTVLHDRNSKLVTMVEDLEKAQEIVREQNAQLSVMALKDPLTGCLNRRALFDRLGVVWSDAKRYTHPVSIIMVDVDHFKAVNDKHGHAVGDQVLQRVAQALTATARHGDVVCRYGGEEFCILLPHTDLDAAEQAAERLRHAIAALEIGSLRVTASLGVATNTPPDSVPEALIERADVALYAAKHTGRNRVVRADRMPANVPAPAAKTDEPAPLSETSRTQIPFPAVTALMAALQQRDMNTAAHCRRVADLCVLVGSDLLDAHDCLVLEVAALLHDIGKVGVPDAILLKPGPLTPEEFAVMDRHSFIGIEIIQAAFKSNQLTYIVRTHHAYFGGHPREINLPQGEAIPLRARILAIVDAYDAMVSDRVYRASRTPAEAFAELRRCAGTQFDPQLVERFIEVVSAQAQQRPAAELSQLQERWVQLSVEAERLASAVDARDIDAVIAVSEHLGQAAGKMEMPAIAALARQLQESASVEHDVAKLLGGINEILALCQSAQEQILTADDAPASARADAALRVVPCNPGPGQTLHGRSNRRRQTAGSAPG